MSFELGYKLSLIFAIFLGISFQRAYGQTGEELEAAYAARSKEKLKEFIDAWANELKPASAEERKKMRRTIRQAYAVFEAFYNPHDLANRGGTEWGNDLYTGFNYLVVQDRFDIFQRDKVYYTEEEARKYAIDYILKNVDKKYHEQFIKSIKFGTQSLVYNYGPNRKSIWEDSLRVKIDSVREFRPNIMLTKAKPLFLTNKYRQMLDKFLTTRRIPYATGEEREPLVNAQSLDRMRFLSNFVKIFPGHWGSGWEMLSEPSIGALIFDKDLKYAKIEYGMIYEGGEAFLEFTDNAWKLISMRRTWIQ